MIVVVILNGKGYEMIIVCDDVVLSEICEILVKNKIGVVVVCDVNMGIKGIVLECDIVWVIGIKGMFVFNQLVFSVMIKDVVICIEDNSVNEVMVWMIQGWFCYMLVVKDGKLIGVIFIGDVVKYKIVQVEFEVEQMCSYIIMIQSLYEMVVCLLVFDVILLDGI